MASDLLLERFSQALSVPDFPIGVNLVTDKPDFSIKLGNSYRTVTVPSVFGPTEQALLQVSLVTIPDLPPQPLFVRLLWPTKAAANTTIRYIGDIAAVNQKLDLDPEHATQDKTGVWTSPQLPLSALKFFTQDKLVIDDLVPFDELLEKSGLPRPAPSEKSLQALGKMVQKMVGL